MQLQHASLRITEYSLHRRAGPKTWEAIGIPQSSLFSHPQIMPDFFILETVYSPWCSACFSLIFTHSIRRRPNFFTIAHCLVPNVCFHRITLSARTNTFGGIVTPICFAVLRLNISWNLAGRSTGNSAALAPLSSLST